jgi:beta-1,4-mannosyltransferase
LKILAWPAFRNKDSNPYNFLLYSAIQRQGHRVDEFSERNVFLRSYDVFHIHWLESITGRKNYFVALVRLTVFAVMVAWVKLRGTGIVWTMHNEAPHDPKFPLIERLTRRFVGTVADLIISLSSSGVALARREFPDRDIMQSAIGHYMDYYRSFDKSQEAKERLGFKPDDTVVLFFGQIARYKNVPKLIDEFKRLDDPKVKLLVGGYCVDEGLKKDIESIVDDSDRIYVSFNRVSDESVGHYFSASDLMALPYRRILNSSSALLALSFGRPVLGPSMGSLIDLQEAVGAENVFLYQGELTTDALVTAIEGSKSVDNQRLRERTGRMFDWDEIAHDTVIGYRATKARKKG